MVELAVLQTVSYIVAALGFAVTCAYYIINLNNTRKTHELQAFIQVFDRFNNADFWTQFEEMMKREWTSINDYENKYSRAGDNVVFPTLEGLGVLLKRRLIDASVPWDLFGNYIFLFWEKYLPIIQKRREGIPDYCLWTEHLVIELRKYVTEHAYSHVLPEPK